MKSYIEVVFIFVNLSLKINADLLHCHEIACLLATTEFVENLSSLLYIKIFHCLIEFLIERKMFVVLPNFMPDMIFHIARNLCGASLSLEHYDIILALNENYSLSLILAVLKLLETIKHFLCFKYWFVDYTAVTMIHLHI